LAFFYELRKLKIINQNQTKMKNNVDILLSRLNKIELQLERVRGVSPLTDGWQTQRLAKKQRKWDELSKEKFNILTKLNELGHAA